jgi:hypothetical protein
MITSERTAFEWFQEAERCYVEGHQGCAWCGGPHRVFKHKRGNRIEYFCNGCDFRTSHDVETGQYVSIPGENPPGSSTPTMHKI